MTKLLAANYRVLIADDSELMCQTLGSYMRQLGCQKVYSVKNGQMAVNAYKNSPFDITFLDIDMPVLNGIEALKKIKELDADAYIVIVSGASTLDNIQNAIAAGANGFIVKPYSPQKLIEAVEKYSKKA